MSRRRASAAIVLACCVALATRVGADTTPDGEPGRPPGAILGVEHDEGARWLVRAAPMSLQPLPGPRLRLKARLEAWALSPDRRRLATVSERPAVLRLIDVEQMRTVARLRMRARGSPAVVVWPRPDRLWIVAGIAGCCVSVATVDPIAHRVVARRRLDGRLVRVAASPDGPVLLLAPPAIIGPTRVATVDAAGAVGEVPLDGVSAGAMRTESVAAVGHVRAPALAVDPARRRAYVVSSRPYVLEIDLRRRRASTRWVTARASLLDRLRGRPRPLAAPGALVGPVRTAAWMGAGRIAVSGYDGNVTWRPDGGVAGQRRPAGLRIIDTRDWSIGTVDGRASEYVAAPGLLLAAGRGGGMAAYSHEGWGRFHALDDRPVEIVASASSVAWLRAPPDPALHAVDLTSGRVLGVSAPSSVTPLPMQPEAAFGL